MAELSDYKVVIRRDDNSTFVAYVPAIEGCHAWGETAGQALSELAGFGCTVMLHEQSAERRWFSRRSA